MVLGALLMVMEHLAGVITEVPEKKQPLHFLLAGPWTLRMKAHHWASGSQLNYQLAVVVEKVSNCKDLILQLPREEERKFSHAEQCFEVNRENPVA